MRSLALLFFFTLSHYAIGAACCNSSSNIPSLITNDSLGQITISTSSAKVIGDAPTHGTSVFRKSSDDEWTHTLTIDASRNFFDLWQIGTRIPFVYKSRDTTSNSASAYGFGDISTTLGYEFLPEYYYSPYKPKGYLFFQSTFPTGSNIYESSQSFAIDARGKGFYTFTLGSLLLKKWQRLDTSLSFAVSKSLNRTFKSSDGSQIHVKPSYDFTGSLGIGYAFTQKRSLRFGLRLTPAYTGHTNQSSYKLVWNTIAEGSYSFNDNWMLSLNYSDQTLIGPARNTSLERAVSLAAAYYFAR